MLKRIDVDAVPVIKGSRYPPPFDAPCTARAGYARKDGTAY